MQQPQQPQQASFEGEVPIKRGGAGGASWSQPQQQSLWATPQWPQQQQQQQMSQWQPLTPFGLDFDPFLALPLELLSGLLPEVSSAVGQAARQPGGSYPTGSPLRMDASENDAQYVIEVEAPGLAPEQVTVEYDGTRHTLHISTLGVERSRDVRAEQEGKGFHYLRKERVAPAGAHRAIRLPRGVKADDISSTLAQGVLRISIPKAPAPEQPARQKIQVQAQ